MIDDRAVQIRAVVFDLFITLTDFDAEAGWTGPSVTQLSQLEGVLRDLGAGEK